jgi:DNA primase
MAFPPGFLDELRARVSLSDLVGRKVVLKRKSGGEFTGLCPFHNEKTPSFTVSEKKGFFYCFGCQEKGSAIDFVMKTEGLPFPEAVEKLAREAGMDVPRPAPGERERVERQQTLQQVVEQAARWFQKQLRLPVGRHGLDYLRGRGLSDATIDDFRLGFAPDSRDGLLSALKREGVPVDKIVEAGLAIQPEEGGREPYDRFRGRVMFTINGRRGRAIAFGGRVMGTGEPKYLNSPETPLFHKGANLYCLDRAREAATKNQPVIVGEGYMDVIALHGAGFTGAVAPLGTALTELQIGELWKLADEPYLCFDGDNAGRRAAARAAERVLPLLKPGKSLRFVALPAGEDPDSLIRGQGPAAIRRVLDIARPLSDLVWDLETDGKPVDTPERRASVQSAIERRVGEIADPMVRDYYRNEMRSRLAQLRRPEPERGRYGGTAPWRGRPQRGFAQFPPDVVPVTAGAEARRAGTRDSARQERVLLGALIEWPALLHDVAEDAGKLPIVHGELQRLQGALLDALSLAHPPGDEEAEARQIAQHLELNGLGRLADLARTQAREQFHGPPRTKKAAPPEDRLGRWRRMAEFLRQQQAGEEDLRQAKEAAEKEPSPENLQRLYAVIERLQRQTLENTPL